MVLKSTCCRSSRACTPRSRTSASASPASMISRPDNYGAPGVDLPFYSVGPAATVSTATPDNLTAVHAPQRARRRRLPESQIAAMHRALDGLRSSCGTAGSIAPTGRAGRPLWIASAPVVGVPDPRPRDRRFLPQRPARDALRLLHDLYSSTARPPSRPRRSIPSSSTMKTCRRALHRDLGPERHARAAAIHTRTWRTSRTRPASNVPPSAFGGPAMRDRARGSFIAPDGPVTAEPPGGSCRLIFDITSERRGPSSSIVSGVQAAATSA